MLRLVKSYRKRCINTVIFQQEKNEFPSWLNWFSFSGKKKKKDQSHLFFSSFLNCPGTKCFRSSLNRVEKNTKSKSVLFELISFKRGHHFFSKEDRASEKFQQLTVNLYNLKNYYFTDLKLFIGSTKEYLEKQIIKIQESTEHEYFIRNVFI